MNTQMEALTSTLKALSLFEVEEEEQARLIRHALPLFSSASQSVRESFFEVSQEINLKERDCELQICCLEKMVEFEV